MIKNITALVIILLMLAGCGPAPAGPLASGTPFSEQTVVAETETPAPVEPTVPVDCAYVWSNRTLEELSQSLNQALQDGGMSEVEAQASAYGEDCLDPQTNTIVRFIPLQTDIYFNIRVSDTQDALVMGEWVERILRVVEQFPPEQVPGPNPGYIGITFASETGKANLWFPRSRAKELIDQGTRGADLYEALRIQ